MPTDTTPPLPEPYFVDQFSLEGAFSESQMLAALARAAELEGDLGILQAELEMVERERDALRADAVRYRWLRGKTSASVQTETADMVWSSCFDEPEALDAAIDAAVAAVPMLPPNLDLGHPAGLSGSEHAAKGRSGEHE